MRVPVVAIVCLCLSLSWSARAAENAAAVLLVPESDMDRELADDLTEVLISAILDRTDKAYRVMGKESFRKELTDRTTKEGQVCLLDRDCIREVGREMNLSLLVVGKVGKAAGGYRLEVWRLSTGPVAGPKPYRKVVAGDVGKLIEEMDAAADWVVSTIHTWLTITVEPADAQVTVGDKVVATDKPIAVKPGQYTVAATANGFEDNSTTVTCKRFQDCTASLALAKRPQIAIKKPPEGDGGTTDVEQVSTGTIVATSVLGGVALVAAGGGIFMYTRMKDAETDADNFIAQTCPGGSCTVTQTAFFDDLDPITDRGERAALWANVFTGVAAVAGAAAATVLIIDLVDGPNEPAGKTAFTPHVSPDFAGFSLDVTF